MRNPAITNSATSGELQKVLATVVNEFTKEDTKFRVMDNILEEAKDILHSSSAAAGEAQDADGESGAGSSERGTAAKSGRGRGRGGRGRGRTNATGGHPNLAAEDA